MLNNLTTICLIYFWGISVKYKLFSNTRIKIDEHSNYPRFMTSMDYRLEITKRGNCVDLFIYFFRGRGNNILTFFFSMC